MELRSVNERMVDYCQHPLHHFFSATLYARTVPMLHSNVPLYYNSQIIIYSNSTE